MYEEVRTQLATASELSTALSPSVLQQLMTNGRRRPQGPRPRVRMFISLDFEWWEKSSETILEVGWSLWDTATQKHRTRHWIIRENLNKVGEGVWSLRWYACSKVVPAVSTSSPCGWRKPRCLCLAVAQRDVL